MPRASLRKWPSWCWRARRSISQRASRASPARLRLFLKQRSNRSSRWPAVGFPGYCPVPSSRTTCRGNSTQKPLCSASATRRWSQGSTIGTRGPSICLAPTSFRRRNGCFVKIGSREIVFRRWAAEAYGAFPSDMPRLSMVAESDRPAGARILPDRRRGGRAPLWPKNGSGGHLAARGRNLLGPRRRDLPDPAS